MQKRFQVEEVEITPKLILIDFFEKDEEVIELFLSHFSEKLSIYLVSKKKIHSPHVQILSSLSEHFFDKLSERVEYSVIFVSSKNKDKVASYSEKLSKVSEKVFVVLQRTDVEFFLSEIENLKKNPNVGIVFLGDVFGERFLNKPFTKIIANAVSQKVFQIGKNALQPVFLISEKDLLQGFEYLFFSGGKKIGLFPLYYKTPNTFTSLMHVLKLEEHELSVSYKQDDESLHKSIDDDELQKRVGGFTSGIRSVLTGFAQGVRELSSLNIKNISVSKKKKKIRYTVSKLWHTLFITISVFACFLALSIGMLFLSVFYFQNGLDAFFAGNFRSAQENMEKSKLLLTYSKPQVSLVLSQADFVSGGNVSSYLTTYSDAVLLSDELIVSVSSSNFSEIDTEKFFANALVLYFLSQNKMSLEEVSFKNYLPLLTIFQEAAGHRKEMNYLVLFQNDNELRPTGGFIGSVAHLTVNKGKFDVEVQDVYALDGQLTEHIEPHFIIRRFLQPHLYLRDSNFHPDFEKSASSAANLYALETGKNIDGVIAIDTEILKAVVKILGPIMLPGTQEKVTEKNVVQLVQEEIHDDFFPGSTEKKVLLSTLFSKIVIGFENDPKKQLEFIKLLPALFSAKHIQVSFNKDHLQRGVIAAGIAGSLKDLRISEDLFKDTIGINEANIGVNKVNEFVMRKLSYAAYLKAQELSSETTVEYKNQGDEDYIMFFRIIVPKDGLLESVAFDSQIQTITPAVTDPTLFEEQGFENPLGLEVSEEIISEDLKSYGFRVIVPRKSTKKIQIITRRPFFETPSSFIYSLQFIKQAGTLPYPITVTLQTAETFNRKEASPVLFNGEAKGDMEIVSKRITSQ